MSSKLSIYCMVYFLIVPFEPSLPLLHLEGRLPNMSSWDMFILGLHIFRNSISRSSFDCTPLLSVGSLGSISMKVSTRAPVAQYFLNTYDNSSLCEKGLFSRPFTVGCVYGKIKLRVNIEKIVVNT